MQRTTAYIALLTVLSGGYQTGARAQSVGRPIAAATDREAARLALQAASSSASAAGQRGPAAPSDWSGVLAINAGDEIVLTTTRVAAPSKHRLLNADAEGIVILNVRDPAVPSDVKDALSDAAEDHPDYFGRAQAGDQFKLANHVRLAAGGVFRDDQRLFDISRVAEIVARGDVVEIGVMGKHVARHAKRGVLIGAAAGAVFMTIAAATCSDKEDCNPAGFALLGAAGGALVGVEIGTIVGAIAPRKPDVVYRADRSLTPAP